MKEDAFMAEVFFHTVALHCISTRPPRAGHLPSCNKLPSARSKGAKAVPPFIGNQAAIAVAATRPGDADIDLQALSNNVSSCLPLHCALRLRPGCCTREINDVRKAHE